jgi:prepilin-type N-terminal cleavage/methylation domain-containing protein
MQGLHTRRRACPAAPRSAGFSLLEVSAALAIGGVILAFAMALWLGGIRERRVVRVAEEIAGLLRFAQQTAVADAVDTCHYQVDVLAARAEVRKVPRDPASGNCLAPAPARRVSEQFPPGVAATVAPALPIQFLPSGSTNSTFTIAVSAGGRSRTVHVHAATGRVEVTP